MSKTTADILINLGACSGEDNAVQWLQQYPDPHEAWQKCDRPDWMLWLLGKVEANKLTVQELACDFTIHGLVHLPPEQAPTRLVCEQTIAVTRRFLHGEAPPSELADAALSARSAAWSAESAGSAAWSAAWSARSAAGSAESAAWSVARSAAGSAAWSAWSAESARSAAGSAESAEKQWQCDRIREYFTADAVITMFAEFAQ